MFMRKLLGCMQCCCNLGRVVCIIINDSNTIEGSFLFETAFRSMECIQTFLNRIHRNVIELCNCDGRKGICNIMFTDHV